MKKTERINLIIGIVGLIFAIVTGIVSNAPIISNFLFPAFSNNSTNSDLYGSWTENHSYSLKNGAVHIDGVVSYFKTGDYNFSGTIGVSGNRGGHSLTYFYTVSGAGTWVADRNSLIIKLQDTKSSKKSVDLDAMTVTPQVFEAVTKQKIPELAEALPKGIAGEFQIVNMNHDAVTLKARDPMGQLFSFTMTRLSDSLTSR